MERSLFSRRGTAVACAGILSSSLVLLPSAVKAADEPPRYTATVTSFHTRQGANGLHFATATLHLVHHAKKRLILGCDAGKVAVTDDQRNRYSGAMVRGIGTVA